MHQKKKNVSYADYDIYPFWSECVRADWRKDGVIISIELTEVLPFGRILLMCQNMPIETDFILNIFKHLDLQQD